METKVITRPVWNEEMRKELSVIVGNMVFNWSGNDSEELDDLIEYAEGILTYHINDNGYELAKEFEEVTYCSPDSELVEILDGIHVHIRSIEQKHVKKWVSDNNLKLEYSIGQTVLANLGRNGEVVCEIMNFYPETMQYGVWFSEIGHEKGKASRYVNAEDVLKLIS